MAEVDPTRAQAPQPEQAEPDARLSGLLSEAGRRPKGPAPVHLWDPPYCGDIGLAIARDGTWSYQGSAIQRPAMIALFASVLRRDPDGFRLVTPVEKVAVTVEDAPFVAVDVEVTGNGVDQILRFRTNCDDTVVAGPDHPLTLTDDARDGFKPYVHIRGGLLALCNRSIAQDLADRLDVQADIPGLWSSEQFFPIASAKDRV